MIDPWVKYNNQSLHVCLVIQYHKHIKSAPSRYLTEYLRSTAISSIHKERIYRLQRSTRWVRSGKAFNDSSQSLANEALVDISPDW